MIRGKRTFLCLDLAVVLAELGSFVNTIQLFFLLSRCYIVIVAIKALNAKVCNLYRVQNFCQHAHKPEEVSSGIEFRMYFCIILQD